MTRQPLRKTGDLPDHARAARERKRAGAEAIGITDAFISTLVERFYEAIRADAMLGPIFNRAVDDWPAHLARLKQFWRSILHASGEFSGNPMRKHMALAPLTPQQFGHWLTLFYATLREIGASEEATREVGARARMIADSLLTGMTIQNGGLAGSLAGADLPWPQ